MNTIYQVGVDENYASIILKNIQDIAALDQLHFERKSKSWKTLDFVLSAESKKKKEPMPDVASTAYSLVFRSDLKNALFPEENNDLEFLEVNVSDSKWLLVNCLTSTTKIDERRSSVSRSITGQIFAFYNMVVVDPDVSKVPCFAIDGSNRANLFFLDGFVSRFRKLGLNGVEFMEIGSLEP